jgi:hypothetical protein
MEVVLIEVAMPALVAGIGVLGAYAAPSDNNDVHGRNKPGRHQPAV